MLLTVGHGAPPPGELEARLQQAGVSALVDVRRFPGSRTSPHLSREELAQRLPEVGIGYRWEERLGGRRSLPRGEPAVDTWWQVRAFQAYAAYSRTAPFREALDLLVAQVEQVQVAVMCSELLWWRCHRRVIADVVALARGVPVEHLMPNGDRQPHVVSDGARRVGDDVRWPGPAAGEEA